MSGSDDAIDDDGVEVVGDRDALLKRSSTVDAGLDKTGLKAEEARLHTYISTKVFLSGKLGRSPLGFFLL